MLKPLFAFLLFTTLPLTAETIASLNGGPIQSLLVFPPNSVRPPIPGPFVASNISCTGQNCGSLLVSFLFEENGSIYRNPDGYNLTFSDNNATITTTSTSVSFAFTVTTNSYFMPELAFNQSLLLAVPADFMGEQVTSFGATVTDAAGTVVTTGGGFVDLPGTSGNRLTSLQITETIGLAPLTSGSATAGAVGTELFVPEPSSAAVLLIGLLIPGLLLGRARLNATNHHRPNH